MPRSYEEFINESAGSKISDPVAKELRKGRGVECKALV